MIKRICKFEGCDRGIYYNDLCKTHYTQQVRGRPLTSIREYLVRRGNQKCSFSGCRRLAMIKGKCKSHYWQVKKGGELRSLRIKLKRDKLGRFVR